MPLFEVLIILMLGSATEDVTPYDDVPMVLVLIVFVILALLYRLVMWLMTHSEKLENLLGGKSVVIIEDGELAWSRLNNSSMTEFEFSMELRLRGVEQLGQARLTILEADGQVSIRFFEDNKMKLGLLILSSDCMQHYKVVPESVDYAYIHYSEIIHMKAGEKQLCPRHVSPG